MIIHHPLDFEQALGRGITRDIAGTPIFMASIKDMITLKKAAGRAQDLVDIEHLEYFLHDETHN